ncbi:MAG: hypothetical protein ACI9GW_002681 [Halieaceae bacterium]|jgi:hypothetical protein
MTTSDMRSEDRFLLPMPMFHVGCLVPVSQLVHRGATGVIVRDIDIGLMFKAGSGEVGELILAGQHPSNSRTGKRVQQ